MDSLTMVNDSAGSCSNRSLCLPNCILLLIADEEISPIFITCKTRTPLITCYALVLITGAVLGSYDGERC
jgi:hypothetical protein